MYKKKGFTLIELLVVISIIALLVAILMPALNNARELATGAVCLGNQKTLITAFIMYCNDNDDNMCSGFVRDEISETLGRPIPNPPEWCRAPMLIRKRGNNIIKSYAGDHPTQETRLNGIREGALYKYINTPESYHCPGDKRWLKGTCLGLPPDFAIYRSYSMPEFYFVWDEDPSNPQCFSVEQEYLYSPHEKKITNIKPPTQKMAFLEMNYYGSENHGKFEYDGWSYLPYTGTWYDPIGNYHNKAASFSFLDGHAELHKWEDSRTWFFAQDPQKAKFVGIGKHQVQDNPRNPDHVWCDRHYPGNYQYKNGPEVGFGLPQIFR